MLRTSLSSAGHLTCGHLDTHLAVCRSSVREKAQPNKGKRKNNDLIVHDLKICAGWDSG
jgi:hypothetical protein